MSIASNIAALQRVLQGELPHGVVAEAQRHLNAIFDEHRQLAHDYDELRDEHEDVLRQLLTLREDAFAAVGRRHRRADDDRDEVAACPI